MKVRLRRALLSLGVVGLLGCGAEPHDRSVVLLVIDTLRADHLSLHGYARATSPALERFATRAAVFERAFGAVHYDVAVTSNNLAALAHAQGDLAEAEALDVTSTERRALRALSTDALDRFAEALDPRLQRQEVAR